MRLFNLHVHLSVTLLALADVILLVLAIGLGLHLSYATFLSIFDISNGQAGQVLLFVAVVGTCLFMMGCYHLQSLADIRIVIGRVMVAIMISVLILSIIFYFVPITRIWLSALVPAMIFGFVGLVGSRIAFRRLSNSTALKRRILVLGTGSSAARIEALEDDRTLGTFVCIGFLPLGNGLDGPEIEESRVLRLNASLPEIAQRFNVDDIVVALEDRRLALPMDELLDCRLHGVTVLNFSTFMERQTGQVELQSLYPSWLVFSEGFGGHSRAQRIAKRSFDVAVSLTFLIFTLPVTVLTALLIWLEDRGPIFYRQERAGLHGKPFTVLKFRSMRTDAEKDGIARWAQLKDPRITRVGSVIRNVRIDEIPQILNVLKGEMSFVGPRPERPSIVSELSQHIPFYKYRHMVKPGITGWAQINYPYGASLHDSREKLKFDVYYIKNYSIFLDFIVLLQTVRVILWPHGAR